MPEEKAKRKKEYGGKKGNGVAGECREYQTKVTKHKNPVGDA